MSLEIRALELTERAVSGAEQTFKTSVATTGIGYGLGYTVQLITNEPLTNPALVIFALSSHVIDTYKAIKADPPKSLLVAYFVGKLAMANLMMIATGPGHPDELIEKPVYFLGAITAASALWGLTATAVKAMAFRFSFY